MSQLHDLTAVEQIGALRARQVSAVELTEHYLARIDAHGEKLGAFVERTPDLARREARQADELLAAGSRLPMLGLPTAFKDLQPVAGVPVHFGSAAVTLTPEVDGPVVGRWRSAGAITLGTTHAPELGPTCFTDAAVVGRPAVTPYDTTRYASGSSGGAAAAVAAGLLPLAHGSDGAGSLRSPAAVCGLVGFKSSRGRMPASPGLLALNVEGAISRTVADAALALEVSWGTDGIYALPTVPPVELETDPAPLRVAVWTDSGLGGCVPEVRGAVEHTGALLEGLGHQVLPIPNPVPWDEALLDHMLTLVTASVAATARRLPSAELLAPFTRWCLDRAEQLGAADFVEAQAALAAAAGRMLAVDADIILTPVTAQPAVPVGWFGEGDECGKRMLEWSAYTPWANIAGQAAIALPAPTPTVLPIGVQLAATRVGDDPLLLRLAAQLERAAPFAHRHPPQW